MAGRAGTGGLPERRLDQAVLGHSRAGAGPAPGGSVVIARKVIIIGPNDGLFIYNGTPPAGKLFASIAPTAGTDQFGNAYVAGIAVYDSAGNPRIVEMFSANPNLELLNAFGAQIANLSSLKDAQFYYADTNSAVQGAIVASIAGKAGTDVFGNAYPQGVKIFQGEFDGTHYIINANGAFFYSSAPALGNLVASITPLGGVASDSFGNTIVNGIVSYTQTGGVFFAASLQGRNLSFFTAPSAGGAYSNTSNVFGDATGNLNITVLGVNSTLIFSPVQINAATSIVTSAAGGQALTVQNTHAAPSNSNVELQGQAAGDNMLGLMVSSDTFNRLKIDTNGKHQWGTGAATQDTTLYRAAAGEIAVDTLVANIAGSPEVWQTLGLPGITGWTSDHGRFRMAPDGETEIDIILHSNGVAHASSITTYPNALPVAYRPSFNRVYPLGIDTTITAGDPFPRLFIDTSGNVRIAIPSVGAATTEIGGNIRMPLD